MGRGGPGAGEGPGGDARPLARHRSTPTGPRRRPPPAGVGGGRAQEHRIISQPGAKCRGYQERRGGRAGPAGVGGGLSGGPCRAARPRASAPAPAPEQALEVVPGGGQQGLAVHLRQPAQPEPSEPVPLLRLTEHGFDPDGPLAHRLRIRLRLVVRADSVEERLVEAAVHHAAGGRRSGGLRRAGVAHRRRHPVAHDALGVLRALAPEGLALGADVHVAGGVVGELARAVDGRPQAPVLQREVGADPRRSSAATFSTVPYLVSPATSPAGRASRSRSATPDRARAGSPSPGRA